jgi:cytochrome c oxidase subunit 2
MFDFPIFPERASTFATFTGVDGLFYALTIFTAAFVIGITILLIALGLKYQKRPGENRPSVHSENLMVEIVWSIIPLVIALGIFVWGAVIYVDYRNIPENTIDISVIGKQWMWKIQHPNGAREVNALHIPVGRPIKLTMTSQDVIHSFYVPAFRVKQDLLPAKYTTMWFEATKTGDFRILCAEYCGTEHSTMMGMVTVLEPADYETWLSGGSALSPVAAGEALFQQMGCVTCHASDDVNRGPSLTNVYGHDVALNDGSVVEADDEYIRESIVNPTAKVVEGFAPLMPANFGAQLSDEDILNLVEYIKSLSDEQ